MPHLAPSEMPTDILEARKQIVADTEEWLGRTALLLDYAVETFPYMEFEHRDMLWSTDPLVIKSRMFTTPQIVLPARPLRSFMGREPAFTRRSATTITLCYDWPASEERGITSTLPNGPVPRPDEVSISHPRPIALDVEQNRPEKDKYKYSNNVSVSGQELDLFRWCAADGGCQFPERPSAAFYSDELENLDIFKDYPPEALKDRPDSVAFHRQAVDKYIAALALVAASLADPELNPR